MYPATIAARKARYPGQPGPRSEPTVKELHNFPRNAQQKCLTFWVQAKALQEMLMSGFLNAAPLAALRRGEKCRAVNHGSEVGALTTRRPPGSPRFGVTSTCRDVSHVPEVGALITRRPPHRAEAAHLLPHWKRLAGAAFPARFFEGSLATAQSLS